MLAEVEAVGSPGKVFALQWLTMDRILVLGTAGVMTTWELLNKGEGKATDGEYTIISAFNVLFFNL